MSPFLSLRVENYSRNQEVNEIRILVVFADEHRIYRDSIASAIRNARPHTEVAVGERGALDADLVRFDPHLIICDPPIPMKLVDGRLAWVELSTHSEGSWRICIGERRWEWLNPSLRALLSVVDETEELARRTN